MSYQTTESCEECQIRIPYLELDSPQHRDLTEIFQSFHQQQNLLQFPQSQKKPFQSNDATTVASYHRVQSKRNQIENFLLLISLWCQKNRQVYFRLLQNSRFMTRPCFSFQKTHSERGLFHKMQISRTKLPAIKSFLATRIVFKYQLSFASPP